MTREQMIEKAARRLRGYLQGHVPNGAWNEYAEDVVDALLPQVTTVEELEALPEQAIVVDRLGWTWQVMNPSTEFSFVPTFYYSNNERRPAEIAARGPLTVVWQP